MTPRDRTLVRLSAHMAAGDAEALRTAVASARRARIPVATIRELALQNYLFLGFPRAINVLAHLPPAPARRIEARVEPAEWRRRGERLFQRIYGKTAERVMDQMRRFHPDLAEWILWEGYGKVLSRPGLTARTRELCVIPVLAIIGAVPQLRAHLRGARNVGASAADVSWAIEAAVPHLPESVRAGVLAVRDEIVPSRRRRFS